MMVRKTAGELDLMDEANAIVQRVLNGIGERIGVGRHDSRAGPLGREPYP